MPSLRQEVLKVYKQILRAGKSWTAASNNARDTAKERQYILSEAKELFRRNKNITGEEEIKQHLLEAQARLQMALHYRNPYPRPVNLPPMSLASYQSKKWKRQEQIKKKSRPVYIKSIDTD